ncbi:hypothetical protein Tco_0844370, partial [Tanacetum coccineum]
ASENTSQGNSDSAHIGVNLNDEAADSEDVEAQEVPAPMGRNRVRRKDLHLVLVRKLQLQRELKLEERNVGNSLLRDDITELP